MVLVNIWLKLEKKQLLTLFRPFGIGKKWFKQLNAIKINDTCTTSD